MLHAIASFLSAILLFFGIGAPAPAPAMTASTTAAVQTTSAPDGSGSAATVATGATGGATAQQTSANASASSQTSVQLPSGSAWLSSVPLGDGKYVTSAPKQDYIYICHVATGGQGAKVNGPWIHGASWTPSEKVAVQGSVSWPDASYSMNVNGSTRTISSNNLPTNWTTGTFPIAASDPAYQYDGNRGTITAHEQSYSLPAYPSAASAPGCIYGAVGIMTNGVILLDGFDALYRDALAHEEQDSYGGHPNNDVGYHYHGFEADYVESPVSGVVGYAFDGYPITGSKLPNGNYLHTADLDECHGLTSAITLDGKTVTTYHYVLTQDFPYSVSCFHGKSYEPKPGQSGQSGQTQAQSQSPTNQGQSSPPGSPPQAAITACASLSIDASCVVNAPNGTVAGTCRMPPGSAALACVPDTQA